MQNKNTKFSIKFKTKILDAKKNKIKVHYVQEENVSCKYKKG